MSKTKEKSNVEYGDPNQIEMFEEHDRLKALKKSAKESGKGERIFNSSIRLTDSYKQLLDNVNVVRKNQICEATIIAEIDDSIVCSITGSKDSIYVDKNRKENTFFAGKQLGDKVDVLIVEITNSPFLIRGSVSELYERKLQYELKNPSTKEAYDALIKSWTPAGYNIDLQYNDIILSSFMPNTLAGVNKLHDPKSIVGQTIKVMIESFSAEKGTYIVSRRKYLQTLILQESKRLKYDTVYQGHITGTTSFGVFVEFNGCLTGMIHKTNINPEWQEKLDQVKPGMSVDFYIKEIIKDKIILTQILKDSLFFNLLSFFLFSFFCD